MIRPALAFFTVTLTVVMMVMWRNVRAIVRDTRDLRRHLLPPDSSRRPCRPPDYEAESHSFLQLTQTLSENPRAILQALADTMLEVFYVGSAGVSLLTAEDGGKHFWWPAIAGLWKPYIGGGTPRDFGPCGDVLDRDASLMFRHVGRRYTYFAPVIPAVEECLLAPFYVGGLAVGTIWLVTHDHARHFDGEDLRQLENLARFASAAYQSYGYLVAEDDRKAQLLETITALEASERSLRAVGRRRDIFVATIAHELRQPVAAMLPALAKRRTTLRVSSS